MAFILPLLALLGGGALAGAMNSANQNSPGDPWGGVRLGPHPDTNSFPSPFTGLANAMGDEPGRGTASAKKNIPGYISGGRNPISGLLGMGANTGTNILNQVNRPPSIADIMSELQRLQDESRYMPDSGALQQQAQAAASAQYDPLIAALRQQMGSAQRRGEQNKQQLGQMFGALSTDLMDDIPEVEAQFDQTAQTLDKQYADLQKSISDQYAQSAKEQQALMQQLNIEAAAPDVFPDQFRDRDFFSNLAETESQTQQSALGQEKRGNVEFTRRGAELARVEGTQRQADLMNELSELLGGFESQIGAHEVAKSNAVQSALGQLTQQAQEYAMQKAQQDFQNYIATINLGRSLRQDEFEMGGASQFPTTIKSPADIPGRAMGMGFSPDQAQNLASIFYSTLSDPAVTAGIDPGTQLALSDEALASHFMEAGRAAGLPEELINALQIMALEYYR